MQRNQRPVSASGILLLMLVLCNAIVLERGLVSDDWYKLLYVSVPLLLLSLIAFRKNIF